MLNDLLIDANGNRIATKEAWLRRSREYKALIEQCMLGHAPVDHNVCGEIVSHKIAQGGAAIHEIVQVFYGPHLRYSFMAHIARPNRAGRFPVITFNMFTNGYECPCEEDAIARGYVIAKFDKEQLFHDERTTRDDAKRAYPGYDWNGIRIWAWGHSKLWDYLLTQEYTDPDKFVVTGHSRGGKAALAAGVFDERVAICAPINSGCGGAGCFRILGDRSGYNNDAIKEESLGRIASHFPHWWAEGFGEYGNCEYPHQITNENTLPFDLHAFRAAMAPRRLFTDEGLDDTWSNPYGSYVTWKAAQRVFDLMGVPGNNGIWFREGGHEFGARDWKTLLDYCDHAFFGKGEIYWNNGDEYFTV